MGVKIFWALVAGFVLGIGIRSIFTVGISAEHFVLVCASSIFILSAKSRRRGTALVIAVFFIALCGGMARASSAVVIGDPTLDSHLGQKVFLEGVVSQEPDVREGSARLTIALASSSAKVLAVLPAFTEVHYGAHVRVSGKLELPQAFDGGDGHIFNYHGYLATQGIGYTLSFAHLESEEGFVGDTMTKWVIEAKSAFVSGLSQALPDPQAGLAAGITVGDKRSLGKDLTTDFRKVSLVHVIVLSGYNITIVIAALFFLLRRFPRWLRFGTGIFVALFFAVMTGWASASLRAALMAIIAISGAFSGRIYAPDRALGLVVVAMLAWNPLLLLYDPGFQLSILATAGLMALSPIIMPHTLWIKWESMREVLTSTVSAQISVLPLLLYSSGTLSLAALPANLLVLVAVPAAMTFSALAAAGGLIAGPAAPFVGFPAYVLLSYMIGVARTFASLPFATLQLGVFSGWWLVPIYIAMILGTVFLYNFDSTKEKTGPQ